MNGFFYVIVTICLVSFGLLFGWVLSSWAGKDTWAALGAIGSWVGGVGTAATAAIALYIAKQQSKDDTYKLKVKAVFSDNFGLLDALGATQEDYLTGEHSGTLTLEAYNSGRRPIEIIRLLFNSKIASGSFELPEFVVPAGCRRRLLVDFNAYIDFPEVSIRVDAGFLYGCTLRVEDAAGIVHEVEVEGRSMS